MKSRKRSNSYAVETITREGICCTLAQVRKVRDTSMARSLFGQRCLFSVIHMARGQKLAVYLGEA